MARERMVTRTVVTTMVDVLVININTAETGTKTFVLTQNMVKDEKTMLNNAQVMLENECGEMWKAVAIKNIKEEETLYGMTEQDFMKYAKVVASKISGNTLIKNKGEKIMLNIISEKRKNQNCQGLCEERLNVMLQVQQ